MLIWVEMNHTRTADEISTCVTRGKNSNLNYSYSRYSNFKI